MTLITAVLVFILGATIASFLSVVIYRFHSKKKGIVLSRSICPHCKKKLKWHHLVPIFSWLFLGGKCGYCGKQISPHYLMMEILTGLLFLATFLNWNFIEVFPSVVDPEILNYNIDWLTFEIFLFYIIEFSFLMAIFFYDLKYQVIPDKLSIPAIGIAAAGGLAFAVPTVLSMIIGAVGIGLFFALQFWISRGTWLGGGDIRLGVLIGILLGWQLGLLALVMAYIIGAILSISLIIQGKATRSTAIAFGPFLVIGIFISIFYGSEIITWYTSLFRI